MVQDFELKLNDRIEVIVEEKAYKALIMDIQNDSLMINLPVNNGEYLVLHSKENIEINSYLDENRCYNFHSQVISRGKEGNIIYYRISKPFDIRKIQRRNFFRVGLLNQIEYKIITEVNKEDFGSLPYKEGLMVDLSGGGLKLKIKDNIKREDLLLVNLKLEDIEIELKCSIIRIENTADKERLCGLEFVDITPVQSEKIIHELFKIIRKRRASS